MCFAIVEHIIVLGSVVAGLWIEGGVFCVREKDAAGLKTEARTAESKCEDDSCMLEKLQLERHSASAYLGVAWGV
jgi:hypothetical protein